MSHIKEYPSELILKAEVLALRGWWDNEAHSLIAKMHFTVIASNNLLIPL